MAEKQRVAVILGPTAAGKSRCAIEIARRLGGEIISGDSMLVYKGMDIGTAKPSPQELALVPHHLVDILPPDAGFSVVDFKLQAERLISEISGRGRLPIIAGGTGLYIKALLEGYEFSSVEEDTGLRRRLEQEAAEKGPQALYERLRQLDPETAAGVHPNNVRRVVRALEAALGGCALSRSGAGGMPYDAVVFGLNMERADLYERINKRVDAMLADGLEAEVRRLLEQGVSPDCQSMQSIGYRQMAWYISGLMDYGQAVEKLKQATRNFAKRQLTWYRKMPYIHWIMLGREPDYRGAADRMCEMLVQKFKLL